MTAVTAAATSRFPRPYIAAGIAMVAAAALAIAFAPRKVDTAGKVDLQAMVPAQFGDWKEVRSPFVQMDLAPRRDDGATDPNSPYDETLMRTYVRGDGATVMLALAWGARQRQEVKIHRPELCYVAQGFGVGGRTHTSIAFPDGSTITATRLVAQNPQRVEPVTYWVRIGDEITQSAWQSRLAILREGLQGRVPDGILVRVSQAMPGGRVDLEKSYAVQEAFLRDLVQAIDGGNKRVVLGEPRAARAAS